MVNEFVINPNSSPANNAQNLANELFKKFPNMTPKNPADEALKTDIKEDVKEDFARAQEVALATEAGKKALKEYETAKNNLIDELITQLPKGAEALKTYKDKIMAIYKENEALKVEQATKATDELNTKCKALQKENEEIKAKLDEVLKRLENNDKTRTPSSNIFASNKPSL